MRLRGGGGGERKKNQTYFFPPQWRLVCDADYIPDLIISLQMVGVLVGALVTGQLADLLGRRKILFAEYLLLLVVWFGSAFVTTWQVYAALRVVIGALVGGVLLVGIIEHLFVCLFFICLFI